MVCPLRPAFGRPAKGSTPKPLKADKSLSAKAERSCSGFYSIDRALSPVQTILSQSLQRLDLEANGKGRPHNSPSSPMVGKQFRLCTFYRHWSAPVLRHSEAWLPLNTWFGVRQAADCIVGSN